MANVESTIMYNPGTTKKFINKTKSRFSPQELIKIDDKWKEGQIRWKDKIKFSVSQDDRLLQIKFQLYLSFSLFKIFFTFRMESSNRQGPMLQNYSCFIWTVKHKVGRLPMF